MGLAEVVRKSGGSDNVAGLGRGRGGRAGGVGVKVIVKGWGLWRTCLQSGGGMHRGVGGG